MNRCLLTVGAALLAATGSSFGQFFVEVSQESAPGAGDFECHVLGVVRPWQVTGTAKDFYNYGGAGNSVSWGGTWTYGPLVDRSQILVVAATDGVALVILHDQPDTANGGGTGQTRVDIIASTTPVSRVVEDDSTSEDFYTGSPGSAFFTASHSWNTPNTDGYVLTGFGGNWISDVSHTQLPTSIGIWGVASFDDGFIPLKLEPNRRVRLRAVSSPQSSSLLALYTYDDGTYTDASGNSRHAYQAPASPKAPPVEPGGYEGQGLVLSSEAWLRCDLDIDPAKHPKLTMGGWAKPNTATGFHAYLHHGNGNSNRALLASDIGANYGWGMGDGNGNPLGVLPVKAGQWQFVAAVYDAAAQKLRLYVDGSEIEGAGAPPAGNVRLFIGVSPNNNNGQFDGIVDNTFVMSEALSKARLDEIRIGGYHRIPTNAMFFAGPECTFACMAGEAVFTVDAGGAGQVDLRWRRDGVELVDGPTGTGSLISGADTSTLKITNVSFDDEGAYDCTASNAAGAAASVPASFRICYADCDCSDSLNIEDFICFQTLYAIGDPMADCDGSATLDINDFVCFQTFYALGC